MNVEFLIHGALDNGQEYWKDVDAQYCKNSYVSTDANELMTCEVVRRDGGSLSSYYTYLRNNDVVANGGRTGSYFGMTVRIDGAICCDVANMYRLLDLIFTKAVVGTILEVLPNGVYRHLCQNSFDECDAKLMEIQRMFAGLFNKMFLSSDDFVDIPQSYIRKNGRLDLSLEDVSKTQSKELLLGGNKLSVSPLFPSAKLASYQQQVAQIQQEASRHIQEAQQDCTRQIQAKTLEFETASANAANNKAQLRREIEQLRKSLSDKERELVEARNEFRRQQLNTEINRTAKDLREPLIRLAGLMAERFPEDSSAPNEVDDSGHESTHKKTKKIHINRKHLMLLIGIVVLALLSAVYSFTAVESKEDQITALQGRIALLQDSIKQKGGVESEQPVDDYTGAASDDYAEYDFSKLWINIKGKTDTEAGLYRNRNYTFEVKGGEFPHNGIWRVNSQALPDATETITDEVGSTVLIEYYTSDGVKVVYRRVNVVG